MIAHMHAPAHLWRIAFFNARVPSRVFGGSASSCCGGGGGVICASHARITREVNARTCERNGPRAARCAVPALRINPPNSPIVDHPSERICRGHKWLQPSACSTRAPSRLTAATSTALAWTAPLRATPDARAATHATLRFTS